MPRTNDPSPKRDPRQFRMTKAQRTALLWARRKYSDGRVPPFLFRDHRTISSLLVAGLIEWEKGYGAPMYRFTHKGLDALEAKRAD